jgi:hypothetical protein
VLRVYDMNEQTMNRGGRRVPPLAPATFTWATAADFPPSPPYRTFNIPHDTTPTDAAMTNCVHNFILMLRGTYFFLATWCSLVPGDAMIDDCINR